MAHPLPAPRHDATAVILAGGRSTRFGSDKASALLQGRPLLEWVLEAVHDVAAAVVIVRAAGQVLPLTPGQLGSVTIADDLRPAEGPVVGLLSGLRAAGTPLAVVVSCDVPLVQPALLHRLLDALGDAEAAIPLVEGRRQPLVAAYRVPPAREALGAALAQGERGLQRALAPLRTAEIPEDVLRVADPELLSFHDLDEPSLLAALERRLSAR